MSQNRPLNDFAELEEIEPAVTGLRFNRGSEADCEGDGFALLSVASGHALNRIGKVRQIGGFCDSPIESILGGAVLLYFERKGCVLRVANLLDKSQTPDHLVRHTTLLVPQFRWKYWRSDWAIVGDPSGRTLLIDCDGREFHDAPEQKAKDARKDKEALEFGYPTIRFSGSEINRDADSCAAKVFEAWYR